MKKSSVLLAVALMLFCLFSCKGPTIDDMIDEFNEIVMPSSNG